MGEKFVASNLCKGAWPYYSKHQEFGCPMCNPDWDSQYEETPESYFRARMSEKLSKARGGKDDEGPQFQDSAFCWRLDTVNGDTTREVAEKTL